MKSTNPATLAPVPARDLTRSLSDVDEMSESSKTAPSEKAPHVKIGKQPRGSFSAAMYATRHRLGDLLPHEIPKTQEDVDRIIGEIDKDGDGKFSKSEVRSLVVQMIEKKKSVNKLKALVAFGVLLLLGYCGVMFGLAVAASEKAKDTTRNGATLQTKTGNVLKTDTVKSYASLLDFPSLPLATIRELQHVTVEVEGNPDSSFMFFKIIGFEKLNTVEVELFTEKKGTSIKIHSGMKTVFVMEDGTARTVLNVASSSRRLLSEDGSSSKHEVRTMSWAEMKHKHNLDRRRRRLQDDTVVGTDGSRPPAFYESDAEPGPADLIDESFISGVCGIAQDPIEYQQEVTSTSDTIGLGAAHGNGAVSDCQMASSSERTAACLMTSCENRGKVCAGEGNFTRHFGGLGYSYPEAWTVNWMPDTSTFVRA
jgi:hypothetical protein